MDVRPNFHEKLVTNSRWQSTTNQLPRLHDLFITPSIISIGDEHSRPTFIGRSLTQKMAWKWKWSKRWWIWVAYLKIWYKLGQISRIERRNPKGGKTPKDEEKGTTMEEEKEPKTPLQWAFEEGEGLESSNKECCGLNTRIIVKSWHQEECGSSSYVHDCKHTYTWGLLAKL